MVPTVNRLIFVDNVLLPFLESMGKLSINNFDETESFVRIKFCLCMVDSTIKMFLNIYLTIKVVEQF